MAADEDFQTFSELADRLKLEDKEGKPERSSFIESAMKRLGYKPTLSWGEPDPPKDEKDGGGGDFFSSGGQYK